MNLPAGGIFPRLIALQVRALRRAGGVVLPRRAADLRHPHFAWPWRWRRPPSPSIGHRPGLPVLVPAARATASPSATGSAKAGHTLLVNKYYLDHLYTDVIAGGTKGPIAKAAYWFNQNVLDGIVNGVAAVADAPRPAWTYKYIDQGVVDGAVNAHRRRRRAASARPFAQLQTGKVQQYGALLFGGAVVLAGIFVFAI